MPTKPINAPFPCKFFDGEEWDAENPTCDRCTHLRKRKFTNQDDVIIFCKGVGMSPNPMLRRLRSYRQVTVYWCSKNQLSWNKPVIFLYGKLKKIKKEIEDGKYTI